MLHKKIMSLVVLVATAFILAGCSNSGNANATTNDIEDFTKEEIFSEVNPNRDYLILVNKNHPYEFGGNYDRALQDNLVFVNSSKDDDIKAEKATYHAFTLLAQRMKTKFNVEIEILEGYNDEENQQIKHSQAVNIFPGLWAESPVGESEYHTGLLLRIGISITTGSWRIPDTKDKYIETIGDNLADFGFIFRYPDDKEDITGYSDWGQIRFVGSAEVAHEIMDRGLCLEEYLGVN